MSNSIDTYDIIRDMLDNFKIEHVDIDEGFKTIRENLDNYIEKRKAEDPEYDPSTDMTITVVLHAFEIVSKNPDSEWSVKAKGIPEISVF
jgi:hypothetical protein